MIRSFVSTYKYYLLLFVILVISELIVNPIGNFPLNDDWTYTKSVVIFDNEGRMRLGDFAAMTLYSHVVWGLMFVKIFGFSFTVLRFSIIIASLIGVFTLNKLVVSISGNKVSGFIAALTLLFSPLYFNLSNTFMTDVSFNTLFVLCCYFAYDFFKTKSKISFVLVFVMSVLLVLIRQFGIIVPVCFVFSCIFLSEKKWQSVIFAILLTGVVYAVFKYYEHYLKGFLLPESAYKFSGGVKLTSKEFWNLAIENWGKRRNTIAMNILVFASPFALLFVKGIIKNNKIVPTLLILGLSFYLVYSLFNDQVFLTGNVLTNMSVGAETFYESLLPETEDLQRHTKHENFEEIVNIIKYSLSTVSITVLLSGLLFLIRNRINPFRNRSEVLFLLALMGAYTFLILITESYFDRYHIPLITLGIILFSFLGKRFANDYKWTIIPLVFFFYVSVAGTKDYLEVNRLRWKAYYFLRQEKNIERDKINGGFEVNCWNEGNENWWYDFYTLGNFDYLIQYRPEPGFKLFKEYPLQRYFPYKKDSVNIFINEKKEQIVPDSSLTITK